MSVERRLSETFQEFQVFSTGADCAANNCRIIADATECQEAATARSSTYGGTVSWSSGPLGCHSQPSVPWFRWNSGGTSSAACSSGTVRVQLRHAAGVAAEPAAEPAAAEPAATEPAATEPAAAEPAAELAAAGVAAHAAALAAALAAAALAAAALAPAIVRRGDQLWSELRGERMQSARGR